MSSLVKRELNTGLKTEDSGNNIVVLDEYVMKICSYISVSLQSKKEIQPIHVVKSRSLIYTEIKLCTSDMKYKMNYIQCLSLYTI